MIVVENDLRDQAFKCSLFQNFREPLLASENDAFPEEPMEFELKTTGDSEKNSSLEARKVRKMQNLSHPTHLENCTIPVRNFLASET